MVDSISSVGSTMGSSAFPMARTLTDEQKQTIQDILSEYDPENLTTEDAQAIFDAFKDAGIKPGLGMKEAIEEAGFDAEELREMGKPAGGPPPGPPPSGSGETEGINQSSLQTLQEILSQYDLSSLTDEDETDLISKLTEAGLMQSGNIIDLST